MQSIGTHGLRELQEKLPLNMGIGETAQLIDVGARLERTARCSQL